MDVPEAFEGLRRADGDGVQGVLVSGEQDATLPEHATPDVERELLEHHDVQVPERQVLEPLLAGIEVGPPGTVENEADVVVGRRRGAAPRMAPEEKDREDVRVLLGPPDEARDGGVAGRLHRPHDTGPC